MTDQIDFDRLYTKLQGDIDQDRMKSIGLEIMNTLNDQRVSLIEGLAIAARMTAIAIHDEAAKDRAIYIQILARMIEDDLATLQDIHGKGETLQ